MYGPGLLFYLLHAATVASAGTFCVANYSFIFHPINAKCNQPAIWPEQTFDAWELPCCLPSVAQDTGNLFFTCHWGFEQTADPIHIQIHIQIHIHGVQVKCVMQGIKFESLAK